MPGPLHGYRVVAVSQMISGPVATMILGDQGADVIKVEPPGRGDLTRALGGGARRMSPIFATSNRNKRGLVLDLKNEKGLDVLDLLPFFLADELEDHDVSAIAEAVPAGLDDARVASVPVLEDVPYFANQTVASVEGGPAPGLQQGIGRTDREGNHRRRGGGAARAGAASLARRRRHG